MDLQAQLREYLDSRWAKLSAETKVVLGLESDNERSAIERLWSAHWFNEKLEALNNAHTVLKQLADEYDGLDSHFQHSLDPESLAKVKDAVQRLER